MTFTSRTLPEWLSSMAILGANDMKHAWSMQWLEQHLHPELQRVELNGNTLSLYLPMMRKPKGKQ